MTGNKKVSYSFSDGIAVSSLKWAPPGNNIRSDIYFRIPGCLLIHLNIIQQRHLNSNVSIELASAMSLM